MRTTVLALVAVMASSTAVASTITIDFEHAISYEGPPELPESVWVTQGFRFETSDGNLIDIGVGDAAASPNMSYCPGCTASMTSDTGQTFSLHSLDMLNTLPVTEDGPITITGFFAGGSQVQTVLNVDANYNTFFFDSTWVDLVEVTLGATVGGGFNGVAVDNIVVTAVPIPAAAWLFGSALAGLGWIRRKQTV